MILHRPSGGKDRAVRDGVNASIQVSRETCSMSTQIVEFGVRLILTESGKYSKLPHPVKRFKIESTMALPA
jgi:hypothetical protein